MICLVYTHINAIHININYICTYSKYSPSSDYSCKHLSIIDRLSSLTQRYSACSCPWPRRTAAWQSQEQLLKKQPICHPEQPNRLTASPCPQPLDLAELLTRRVKYTASPAGAGCRLQQEASGCRGRLQQPGLVADGTYLFNIDI